MRPQRTTPRPAVSVACLICGRPFGVWPAVLAKGAGKYCSRACADAARSRNRRPLADRFWEKVDKNGPLPNERPDLGPCWIWTGQIDKAGYGRISLGGRGGGSGYAHHVSLDLAGVPVPEGFDRDHLCRRRHCCRPDHLEPVTTNVNLKRGASPAMALHRSGRCANGHEATDENVYRRKSTGAIVYCRPCRREKRGAGA